MDPVTIAIAATAVAGGVSASQQMSAGKIADIESKTEAKQIETAAAQREADRKEQLARAVSSQMAAGGASGISFEGSPLSVLEEDVRREKEATQRDTLMSKIGAQSARAKGKVAKAQAKGAAITSLLQTGASIATLGASGAKQTSPQTSINPATGNPNYGGTGGPRRGGIRR